jgi:hypothetical protein
MDFKTDADLAALMTDRVVRGIEAPR